MSNKVVAQDKAKKTNIFKNYGTFFGLIVLILIAVVFTRTFISPANLQNVVRQAGLYGIAAIGATFILLTGGIDLSTGSLAGLVSTLFALMISELGVSVELAVVLGIAIGLLGGAINGAVIVFGKVVPFITTLGTMTAYKGIGMYLTAAVPVPIEGFSWMGSGKVIGLPVPFLLFVIALVIAFVVLKYTAFGRAVYAFGDNKEAARLAGINIKFINFMVYVIAGFASAITALMFSARLGVGQPTIGEGLEMQVISMAVIGGTSITGGRGGVWRTLVGVLVITVLANMLNLFHVNSFVQDILQGVIIVAAVFLDTFREVKK